MTVKKNNSVKNFITKAKAKIHECGLVAAINAADPFLRDDEAVRQTKNDIEMAILIPTLGTGIVGGSLLAAKYFPREEAEGIAKIFTSFDPNHTPRMLTTIFTTAVGFGIGAKLSATVEKMLDKARIRNAQRKEKLKSVNPEKFAEIDAKNAVRAEKHVTRNDRIKQKYEEWSDKRYDAHLEKQIKRREKQKKRSQKWNDFIKRLSAKKRNDQNR